MLNAFVTQNISEDVLSRLKHILELEDKLDRALANYTSFIVPVYSSKGAIHPKYPSTKKSAVRIFFEISLMFVAQKEADAKKEEHEEKFQYVAALRQYFRELEPETSLILCSSVALDDSQPTLANVIELEVH